jgi:phosphate transport system permease protein
MTAAIAAEMGEASVGSDHYHALFAIALVLFLVTFLFNVAAEFVSRRFRLKLGLSR